MSGRHQSSRQGRATPWEGYAALHAALEGLATAKGISQSRIGAVAKLALQYSKAYKHVVHDVELFLWKADVEHRLAGLYAIDAIIRQGNTRSEAKEQFAKRFSIRLAETINAVRKVPDDAQSKVRHVFEEWQKRGVYSSDLIEDAGGHEYVLKDGSTENRGRFEAGRPSSLQSNNQYSPPPTSTTPTASSGKLASLLSIIKKKKEQVSPVHGTANSLQPPEFDDPLPRELSPYSSRRRSRDDSPSAYHRSDRSYRDEIDDDGRGRRMSGGIMGDAPPSGLLGSGPPRRESDRRSEEWPDESRAAKKSRSSRWGPPKAADNRPSPSAPMNRSDDFSRSGGGDTYRQSPRRSDERGNPSFEYSGGSLHSQSRDNRGPDPYPGNRRGSDSYARYDDLAPPRGQLSPERARQSSSVRGNAPDHGYKFRHDEGRYSQNEGQSSAGPSPRYSDRVSAHQGPQNGQQPPSDVQAGMSGEICRKFLAGRCTFGDHCRNIHEGQDSQRGLPPRTTINEAKRKTVLCKNFPLGKCRFGDKCSFAHGVDEIESSAGATRPLGSSSGWAPYDESPRGRWDASLGGPSTNGGGNSTSEPYSVRQTSSAPPSGFPAQHQSREYGAVYNERQDARGPGGGASVSSASARGPAARRPSRFHDVERPFGAPGGAADSTLTSNGGAFAQGSGQRAGEYRGSGGAELERGMARHAAAHSSYAGEAGSSGQQPRGSGSGPSSGVRDDDDEPDVPAEQFELHYDDED